MKNKKYPRNFVDNDVDRYEIRRVSALKTRWERLIKSGKNTIEVEIQQNSWFILNSHHVN
jgi:hypothetical protein